jgi:CrcB protein
MPYLAVAIGGALGAMARFWVYNAFLKMTGDRWPWATFTVNVLGSFLIGIFFVMVVEKSELAPEVRSVLLVGFLGAFTTFSTFSLDAFSLFQQGETLAGLTYIVGSVLVCLLAVWGGLALARLVF